ncbi:MAG: DUF5317 domain-containing protein [Clostridiales bacterium]|jgi:lipoprotein signal peptidase|nr:DUF5317 domain-containing protein [Clostridiales bacterium]
MFILYAVAIGILAGYIRGGRMKWLTLRPLKHNGLAIGGFAIQIILFSGISFLSKIPRGLTISLHVISYILLLLFTFFNRKITGIPIIGTGILSNALAISLNGGYMPTYIGKLEGTSMGKYSESVAQGFNNSIAITDSTKLPWLCDIFHLPEWLPFSNVFSIGDVIIAVGVCLYLIFNMQPSEKKAPNEPGY